VTRQPWTASAPMDMVVGMRLDVHGEAVTRPRLIPPGGAAPGQARPSRRRSPTRQVPRRSAVPVAQQLSIVVALVLAGCASNDHAPTASTVPARPDGSAATASTRNAPRTLQYRDALPDCRTLRALLPTSVIGARGSLGVSGRSADDAAWQAISCQYLDGAIAADVTVDRPRSDPVDGQPAAVAAAARSAVLLATRAHCSAVLSATEPDQVLRCPGAGATPPGTPAPAAAVAFVAGAASAFRTVMVSVTIDGPSRDRAQGLADLLYRTVIGSL
jgi:hypothetical protein